MDEDDIKLIQGYFICGAVLTIKKIIIIIIKIKINV